MFRHVGWKQIGGFQMLTSTTAIGHWRRMYLNAFVVAAVLLSLDVAQGEKEECRLRTFSMFFPNSSDHDSMAERNVSQRLKGFLICFWAYPTKQKVTAISINDGADRLFQVELYIDNKSSLAHVTWQNVDHQFKLGEMRTDEWSHLCFEKRVREDHCNVYVDNENTDSLPCNVTYNGWINGTMTIGQKVVAQAEEGTVIEKGVGWSGMIAALQINPWEVGEGLANTELACKAVRCKPRKKNYPGDFKGFMYWPVRTWTRHNVPLKMVRVPCAKHNLKVESSIEDIVRENEQLDKEAEERRKKRRRNKLKKRQHRPISA